MQSINVRRATSDDLTALVDIWYDSSVVTQQVDNSLSLIVSAKADWIISAEAALANPQCAIWVACPNATIIGYMTVWIHAMPVGFSPRHVGCVTEMALDLHNTFAGAGRALTGTARQWLLDNNIDTIIAQVHHRQPVQQAFWRGQGARKWMDLLWLKL